MWLKLVLCPLRVQSTTSPQGPAAPGKVLRLCGLGWLGVVHTLGLGRRFRGPWGSEARCGGSWQLAASEASGLCRAPWLSEGRSRGKEVRHVRQRQAVHPSRGPKQGIWPCWGAGAPHSGSQAQLVAFPDSVPSASGLYRRPRAGPCQEPGTGMELQASTTEVLASGWGASPSVGASLPPLPGLEPGCCVEPALCPDSSCAARPGGS